MQFSEHWLRQFVDTSLDSKALEHALTMAGLEVEERMQVGGAFTNVVVGEILSAEKHPDADRLQLCKVDVGEAEPLQIVCGAPNARVGLKAPCALVGAKLADFKIKKAKVRGVESFGMMCSAKELGLAEEADGLLELDAGAVVGQCIREHLDLDDYLFTIKLTPNRADCLSMKGIARDVAAITGAQVTLPAIKETPATVETTQTVKVSEPAACPAYYGRVVEGVDASVATPDWMVKALERSGVRSISILVDITNYVLLELGQPMHAFDLDTLHGEINVRFAQADESLMLLNESEVNLSEDDLVIADGNGPIALAGIMGGQPTSVQDKTRNIFLEAAFFTPDVMAGKARRHGLSTDSSYRFERGVDYGSIQQALSRATDLVVSLCGGKAGEETAHIATLPARKEVTLRFAKVKGLLGIDISKAEVGQLLKQLGFVFDETDTGFSVQAPTYRFDIEREVDLIEEIARLHGYDKIPAITPVANLNILPEPEAKRNIRWLKSNMQSQSYQEVVTYSFVDASWEQDLMRNKDAVTLKNPIASNMSVMRSSLWGGLLDVLQYNINRKQERAQLFELGSTFHRQDNGYREQTQLAGLHYGAIKPEQWAETSRDVDFYDVKAIVDILTNHQAEYRKDSHVALHPGQTARIYLNNQAIGWLGKLHPKWQQAYDLPKSTILFELEIDLLLDKQLAHYEEVSKFLPVRRDVAVVVAENIDVQEIIDAVYAAKIPLLQKMQLFDIYQGKGIDDDKKSLAFLILMQDTHKTMVDKEVDDAMATLIQLLQTKFNAQLRN